MKCVFAGTFDPLTKGHLNIIKRCAKKFSFVYVVIGENAEKTAYFPLDLRVNATKSALKNYKNVEVINYAEVKENYAKFLLSKGVKFYVRGIRNKKDLEYEKQFEEINKKLYPEIKTVYFTADKRVKEISSSFVKERLGKGLDIKMYVPSGVYSVIKNYKR